MPDELTIRKQKRWLIMLKEQNRKGMRPNFAKANDYGLKDNESVSTVIVTNYRGGEK